MKTFLLIAVVNLFMFYTLQAQNDSTVIKDVYRIWTTPTEKARAKPWGMPTEKGRVTQGVLFEVKDSSLLISDKYKQKNYDPEKITISKVDARSIDVVKFRKKGSAGMGILIGAISGLVVGGAMDLIIYSSWKNKEINSLENGLKYFFVDTPQFIAGIAGSIGILGAGIGIGGAIGSATIKIPIKGSQKLFDKNKSLLNDYSIKQNSGLVGKSFSNLRDTIVDIDGNVYHTIALGGQVWMAENLRVTRYRDGSQISSLTNNASGAGLQYNWFAVNNNKNLCPAGWHVPSLDEWTSLINSLGGEYDARRKMEEGFSAEGQVSQWWSSTEQDTLHAKSFYLNNQTIGIMFTSSAKTSGLSVRCIRDY
ncbi:MAG: hypothetical protein D4R97_02905 [Bacteroidetes bacterium]|nr:MAG: hypothetical protein D4R97_02905 [Bacteroidota bacterium]